MPRQGRPLGILSEGGIVAKMGDEGHADLTRRVQHLDEARRLKNARLLGFGLAICVLPTVFSNELVDDAPLLLRLVPVATTLVLALGGLLAHFGQLRWAVVGIVLGGAGAMLAGVATHPQLWASPYGLGLLVLAASTIASPRAVLVTMLVALVVLGLMGVIARDVPPTGAPVAFTLVTAAAMLVMAALITILQVRTAQRTMRDMLEGERRTFEAERRADALHLQLTEAQRMESLGQLAGGVAHDFNNYLHIIGASSELAQDSVPPGHPAREALEPARTAVSQAANLTEQLLTFSRRQALPSGTCNVNEALASLSSLMKLLVGSSVQVEIDIAPGEHNVRLGPGQLEQVLMNLVVNARDAMARKGRLKIMVRGVPEARTNFVEMSVSDTGPGIAEEVRERIFDPFFTTKPEGQGTGLGLPTCKRLVHEAGGTLEFDSVLGEGTTFHIQLPCA
jgi:signal transduction histidine kinase